VRNRRNYAKIVAFKKERFQARKDSTLYQYPKWNQLVCILLVELS
jgi:hypothetical protein